MTLSSVVPSLLTGQSYEVVPDTSCTWFPSLMLSWENPLPLISRRVSPHKLPSFGVTESITGSGMQFFNKICKMLHRRSAFCVCGFFLFLFFFFQKWGVSVRGTYSETRMHWKKRKSPNPISFPLIVLWYWKYKR